MPNIQIRHLRRSVSLGVIAGLRTARRPHGEGQARELPVLCVEGSIPSLRLIWYNKGGMDKTHLTFAPEAMINQIRSNSMATQADLDTQITELEAEQAKLASDLTAALAALQAKASIDLQPEIDRLKTLLQGQVALDAQVAPAPDTTSAS